MKRIAIPLMLLMLGASPAAYAAPPVPKSIGGEVVASQASAPWSVFIQIGSNIACSGTIIDATHVLTAAHCTAGGQTPPSSYLIYAGVSTLATKQDKEEAQQRKVSAERVEPQYRSEDHEDDIAELTLSEALVFGPDIQSIPIVGVNAAPPIGQGTRMIGWGEYTEGFTDWKERSLVQTRVPQTECASGMASLLCSRSESGSPCYGDSGAGVVSTTGSAVLLGVEDFTVSPVGVTCAPNFPSGSTNLSTPEIQAWLAGDPNPPQAPRSNSKPTISQLTQTEILCNLPPWTGAPNLQTLFVDATTGALLQSGPSPQYRIEPNDNGRSVRCVSIASNDGGTTEAGPSPSYEIIFHQVPKPRRSSRMLVHFGAAKRIGHRWRIRLSVAKPLQGVRLKMKWQAKDCAACAISRSMKIGGHRTLVSPPVDLHSVLSLSIMLPSVQSERYLYLRSVIHRRFR